MCKNHNFIPQITAKIIYPFCLNSIVLEWRRVTVVINTHNDFDNLNDQEDMYDIYGYGLPPNTADFKGKNSLQTFYSSLSKKYFKVIKCISKKMITTFDNT